jgi:subtilase family serine protease
MHARLFPLAIAALAAACTSSSPEPKPRGGAKVAANVAAHVAANVAANVADLPDLIASGSCSHVEDTLKLAVAVSNLGNQPAARSATRVEFRSDGVSSVARPTRTIAPHAVASFEIEFPAACSRTECTWKVTADSDNQVEETDEANNSFAGRC